MPRLRIDESSTAPGLAYKLYGNSSFFRQTLDQSYETVLGEDSSKETIWSQLLSSVGGTENSLGLHLIAGVESALTATLTPAEAEIVQDVVIRRLRSYLQSGGEGIGKTLNQYLGEIFNESLTIGLGAPADIVNLGADILSGLGSNAGATGKSLEGKLVKLFKSNRNAIGQLPVGEVVDYLVPLERVTTTAGSLIRPFTAAANALRNTGFNPSNEIGYTPSIDVAAALEGYASEAISNIAERNGISSTVDIQSVGSSTLEELQSSTSLLIPWNI